MQSAPQDKRQDKGTAGDIAMFSQHDGPKAKTRMISPGQALPGRPDPIPTATRHFVSGRPLSGPYPRDARIVYFGMGCFWGAERLFWQAPGVWVTAVGYQGGYTPNPT
jgi:peptide-methionine (S)-S-oxide reductase